MMYTQNTVTTPTHNFDKGYKWLHWLMAVLILLMLFALLGFNDSLTKAERMEMLVGHSSIGSLVSILLILRVFKRFIKKDAVPEQNISQWQKRASKWVQMSLYACMILVPLTGYLTARAHELPVMAFASINLSNVSTQSYDANAFLLLRSLHEWAISFLVIFLVLHIGGALFHKLIKKDQVMASITRTK